MALTDALDDLIGEGRIAPQLAMKILSNFDRHVMEVLEAKVKANMTFKVRLLHPDAGPESRRMDVVAKLSLVVVRDLLIPIVSATKCGLFFLKTSRSSFNSLEELSHQSRLI